MFKFNSLTWAALVLLALLSPVRAADPGLPLPETTEASDQKLGSLLIFPFYSSSATAPASEDTRLALTNTNPTMPVTVMLHFINGESGAVRISYLCLQPNQIITFTASAFDPGVRGFAIILAVNNIGAPIKFNHLVGEADIKLATGPRGSLKAIAVAALNLTPTLTTQSFFTLNFNGVMYNKLPRVLSLDNLRSVADGNTTVLVVNRLSNLILAPSVNAPPLNQIFGVLYDEDANPFSVSFTSATPQLYGVLSDSFPLMTPRYSNLISTGRRAWLRLYKQNEDIALCGAVLNSNANAAANAFTGARNLRAVTLTTASMSVAVYWPPC